VKLNLDLVGKKMTSPCVFHQDELKGYAPPSHTGITNIRLVDRTKVANQFEMILGSTPGGGSADAHYHEHSFQVYYILEGTGGVKIGDDPPAAFKPGSVIVIPPGVEHSVWGDEGQTGRGIVIYSPPLPENGFKSNG